jgi:indolepyruvate ferredoxin oxidoreductase alpha subunit
MSTTLQQFVPSRKAAAGVAPAIRLASGDEAVAMAARDAGVALGTGYPGTPSTEILEALSVLGGHAQWAPNEKVALEVGLGAAFAGARVLVTMKHVGLNVASDPLFTAAYTGVTGGLVVVVADDPGMSSSQNEQDSRHYALAAGVPMIEPSDSQDAYDFARFAFGLSERWHLPILLRMTTRVCHGKSLMTRRPAQGAPSAPHFVRDVAGRVMVPGYARPAHRRLREKLAAIAFWTEECELNTILGGPSALGIITSGVSAIHAAEAAPEARILKLGTVWPLPLEKIRSFAASVQRCVVVEEGDPFFADAIRAAGIAVESKPEMFRFGELHVGRVRRILARDTSPEPVPPRGKAPELCQGCPYHPVFDVLKKMDCIVAGDIGCYTLGVMPPYQAIDTCVAMGASIGVGLGLRHVLPEAEARRVVSVIGDSTFIHSGLTGVVEMVYNPPKTGHVVLILDNGITAMTGAQENPATGRTLEHDPTGKVSLEGSCRALGVANVDIVDAVKDGAGFEKLLRERLAGSELSVVIARRACILAAVSIKGWDKAGQEKLARCSLEAQVPQGGSSPCDACGSDD